MSQITRLFNIYLHVLSSSLVCRLSLQCSQWIFSIVSVIAINGPCFTQILEQAAVMSAINWWWLHRKNTGCVPFLPAISFTLNMTSSRQNMEGMNRSLNATSDHHSDDIRQVIQHPNPDIEQQVEACEKSIIGKVLSEKRMSPYQAEDATHLIWPDLIGNFYLRCPAPNIFVIKFDERDDLNFVLVGTPWSLDGKLFIIHAWNPTINYRELDFQNQTFWTALKNLPLEFMNSVVPRQMGSLIGNVLKVDP